MLVDHCHVRASVCSNSGKPDVGWTDRSRGRSIIVAAMLDTQDRHGAALVVDRVQDAVGATASTPDSVELPPELLAQAVR